MGGSNIVFLNRTDYNRLLYYEDNMMNTNPFFKKIQNRLHLTTGPPSR